MIKEHGKERYFMTPEEKQIILKTLDMEEESDYILTHYSSWKNIKDEKFHQLLDSYINAYDAIIDYIHQSPSE